MATYEYTMEEVRVDDLEQKIADEAYSVSLLSTIVRGGTDVTLEFDGALTSGEEDALDALIAAYEVAPAKPGDVVAKLKDGVDAPSTITDCAQLYVDVADGKLKVKFGDGTVVVVADPGA